MTRSSQPEILPHHQPAEATVVALTQRGLFRAKAITGAALDLDTLRFQSPPKNDVPGTAASVLVNHLSRTRQNLPSRTILIWRTGTARQAQNAALDVAFGCGRGRDKHGAMLLVRHLVRVNANWQGAIVLRLSKLGNATWNLLTWREHDTGRPGMTFATQFHTEALATRHTTPISLSRIVSAPRAAIAGLAAEASYYFESKISPSLRNPVILSGLEDAFLATTNADLALLQKLSEAAFWREPDFLPFYPLDIVLAPSADPQKDGANSIKQAWSMMSKKDENHLPEETYRRTMRRLAAIVRRHPWSPERKSIDNSFQSGFRGSHWNSRMNSAALRIEAPTGHDAMEACETPDVI